ncbi:MAG: sensor histidine kinase [Bacteroidota bacterium]
MKERYTYLDQLLQNRVLVHVLFWLATLFSAPLVSEYISQEVIESLVYRGVGLPLKVAATYLLVYYQIPRLLQKKKYFQFLLSFFLTLSVFSIAYRFNNIHIAETLMGASAPKESLWQILHEYKITVIFYGPRVYFTSIVFLFLKMIKDWALNKQQVETLQKEKINAELSFLKAQLHPHFLFNTLNNIYALALKKSDQTPEVVAKLSEILDYMLYQCNEDRVLVSKEINLLTHYIELERIRYGERLLLTFQHELENNQARVAPLVLLSIVENAFKHGASGTISNPRVEITLIEKKGILSFRVFNSKPKNPQEDKQAYKKGIGAANIKRQLELAYPKRHSWEIREEADSYEVQLEIEL